MAEYKRNSLRQNLRWLCKLMHRFSDVYKIMWKFVFFLSSNGNSTEVSIAKNCKTFHITDAPQCCYTISSHTPTMTKWEAKQTSKTHWKYFLSPKLRKPSENTRESDISMQEWGKRTEPLLIFHHLICVCWWALCLTTYWVVYYQTYWVVCCQTYYFNSFFIQV